MSKFSIVFWNLHRRALTESLAKLVKQHDVDVLVLAELALPWQTIRRDLSRFLSAPVTYSNILGVPTKTHVFVFNAHQSFNHVYSDQLGRLNMFDVTFPFFPRFVMATIHAVSKDNNTDDSLAEEARLLMCEIRSECNRLEVEDLILCGDFNLNPYDKGMLGAGNFHAVMDLHTARRGEREIQKRKYPLLYNPMWSLFGDFPKGPPGTFYRSSATHFASHWHMLDQFLLSPSLIEKLKIHELEILAGVGEESFLTEAGLINSSKYSDHLPITITLKSNS